MNMIVSIRTRAHRARAVTMDVRNVLAAPRSITPSTHRAAPVRCNALRARWSTDPVSGRLECRWSSEDDVPDSRRDARRPKAGERRSAAVKRLAA